MGKWSHTFSVKAFADRKKPNKRDCDWLLKTTLSTFYGVVSYQNMTFQRFLYRIAEESEENFFWHYERVEQDGEHIVNIVIDVHNQHPVYNPIDHWLELFIAKVCNPEGSNWHRTRIRMAEKNFELLPTEHNYRAMLTASNAADQYIFLERGFYLLQRLGNTIVPLEKSKNLAEDLFRPQQTSFEPAIPIEFFKQGEQARIKAHFESDYCLCGICQAERTRLGLV